MTGRVLFIFVVLGVGASTLAAQDAPQVFRGGTRSVPVYATVNDRQGGFVLDLTRDDFEIRDNGKLQAVTQFASDLQPLSLLILIDGSSSMLQVFNSVIEASNSLINHMQPADRTAIASFADRFQMRQPFTSNRDELLKHLEDQFNIRVAGETRLWGSLAESVLALTREQGRRVVVVLSDGKEWINGQGSLGQMIPGTWQLSEAPFSLVSLALDHDVMVYAIAVWTHYEQLVERPSRSIELLSTQTGGGYVEMRESDEINTLASRIMKELHQQYVLGFTPTELDGKTHKLDVKVKRAGVTVKARRSYIATKADKVPEVPEVPRVPGFREY